MRLAHPSLDGWLARLLCLRGVEEQQVENFLEPRVRELMPDPSRLADMDKAIARLVQALVAKQRIGIITDYDVDGACCAAMFISYWRALGGLCSYTTPDRLKEGYGANSAAFARLFDDGVEGLVLTSDCGTNQDEVFAQARKDWAERSAKERGLGTAEKPCEKPLQVIVLDHHEIDQHEIAKHEIAKHEIAKHEIAKHEIAKHETTLVRKRATSSGSGSGSSSGSVFAMVNPQRADNQVDATSLAACGVVFMLLVALRRKLLEDKLLADNTVASPPELKPWLDLVALATICDVVELSPLNRAFVRLGLRLLTSRRHVGLAQMAEVGAAAMRGERASRMAGDRNGDREVSTRDLGFFFGPRLNACGRMGHAYLAVELLLCVDSDSDSIRRAQQLARKIEELNAERRQLQATCYEQVLALAQQAGEDDARSKACFFSSPAWSIGVLGPCASRVAERLGCPIFLASEKLDSASSASSQDKSTQAKSTQDKSPQAKSTQDKSPQAKSTQDKSPQDGDLLRGSARLPQWGWDSFNLARVAMQAKEAGLLLSAGGHSRACGFSLHRETLADFTAFLSEASNVKMGADMGAETGMGIAQDASASAEFRGLIDMELLPSAATMSLAQNLSRLAPFGRGNEEPLFAFRDVFIDDCRFVGKAQRHLVCSISSEGGVSRAHAIAYDAHASGLGCLLRKASDERRPRWLVGKVRIDNIGRVQVVIEDFACFIEGAD